MKIEAIEENDRIGLRLLPVDGFELDVFLSLCSHLNKELSKHSEPKAILKALTLELRLWQLFFSNGAKPLSLEGMIGLTGELFTLESIIDSRRLPEGKVLETWTGRPRGLHDFSLPKCSLEVKSSIEKNRCGSIYQLPVNLMICGSGLVYCTSAFST